MKIIGIGVLLANRAVAFLKAGACMLLKELVLSIVA
jgi:hypothetical protein